MCILCLNSFSKTSKIKIYELKFSNCSNFNILLWFLINLINEDAFVLAVTADMCSMVHLVCLLIKTLLLTMLQDNLSWLGLLCLLEQVVWMREEYKSILPTLTEADKIGRFCRYRCFGKTQISADYIGQADISVYL